MSSKANMCVFLYRRHAHVRGEARTDMQGEQTAATHMLIDQRVQDGHGQQRQLLSQSSGMSSFGTWT